MNWKSFSTLTITIIIVVALAYGSSLSVGLLSDDHFIFESVSELSLGHILQKSFSTFREDFFRPLPQLWWWISYQIWGENFSGYHLESVIVHILNSLLVGFLAFKIYRSRIAAWVSSILFAVFPLHPEAVTWLAGRFDLLAVLWSLAALTLWMEWRDNGGALRYWFVHVCIIFAMLSKESALILPILIFGLEWMCHDDFKKRVLSKMWWLPGVLLWLGVFTWRWQILGGIGGYQDVKGNSLWQSLDCYQFASNLKQSLPFFLSPLHEDFITYRIPLMIASTLVIFLSLMIIILKGVGWGLWKRLGGIITGLFVTMAPVLPLLFFLKPDLRGSRYLYFSAVFAALFIGGIMANLWVISKKWKYIVSVIFTIWTVGFIGLSRYHVSFWNEATTISNRVLESLVHKVEMQSEINALHIIYGPEHHRGASVFYCGLHTALDRCIGKRKVMINYLSSYVRDKYIDRYPTKGILDQVPRETLGESVSIVRWDFINMCYEDISDRLSQTLATRDSGEYSAQPKWYDDEDKMFSEWSVQDLHKYSSAGVYHPTGDIPYIHSPPIELIPQLIDSIKMSVTVQVQDEKHEFQIVDFSWVSKEYGQSPPEFTRRIVLPVDGSVHEVCFPMACDAFWVAQDTITSISFGFPGLSSPIQLHSIECYGPGEEVANNSP